jgi:hypothetical protein
MLEASPVLAREACRELRDWGSASGPDRLVQRISMLLDLAADGSFEELSPRCVDGYYKDCVLWSSVDRGSFGKFFPDGPDPGRGLPEVAPFIAVRCGSCGRDFVQRWVWERGYEIWTVGSRR